MSSNSIDLEDVIFKSAIAFLLMLMCLMFISFGLDVAGIVGAIGAALMIVSAVAIGYAHEVGHIP